MYVGICLANHLCIQEITKGPKLSPVELRIQWFVFRIEHNNGPNGHLFYVGGDLMLRRGMLPIIMLPDGDLRIVLHLVPF